MFPSSPLSSLCPEFVVAWDYCCWHAALAALSNFQVKMLSISFLEVRSASTTPLHREKARWSVRVDHGGKLHRTRFIKLAGTQQKVSISVLWHSLRGAMWQRTRVRRVQFLMAGYRVSPLVHSAAVVTMNCSETPPEFRC